MPLKTRGRCQSALQSDFSEDNYKSTTDTKRQRLAKDTFNFFPEKQKFLEAEAFYS